jgi:hypothetical protein
VFAFSYTGTSAQLMRRQARNAALSDDTSNPLLITAAVQRISQDTVDAMTDTPWRGATRWFWRSAADRSVNVLQSRFCLGSLATIHLPQSLWDLRFDGCVAISDEGSATLH